MSRVLIWGGSGFIGQELALEFARKGEEVISLGRESIGAIHSKVSHHVIDFDNKNTWKGYIEKNDKICFLIPFHMPNKAEVESAEKKHLDMIRNLIIECVEKKIDHFLFVSSGGAIYGVGDHPFTEEDLPNPVSSYGKLKLKIETMLNEYGDKYGLSYSVARPSNVYGEKQNPLVSFGAITTFFYRISNGLPIDIFGDLGICKDYLNVKDLAPALVKMVLEKKQGVYNLGFGQTYTLGEIVERIEKILGKKAQINFHKGNTTDIRNYRLNCTKAQRELDFHPQITLEDGIKLYLKK